MTLSRDIALLLQARGHGTYTPGAVGGTITLGELPSTPDEAIAVAEYPGPPGDAALPWDQPRVQLTVRGGQSYEAAAARAQALYDALVGLGHVTFDSGAHASLIFPIQSGPVHMPRDGNGRARLVVNIGLHLHRPSPHRSFTRL